MGSCASLCLRKPDLKATQSLAKLNAKLAWTTRDVSQILPQYMEMKYLKALETTRRKK